jgi:hypothetical protein
MSHTVKRSVPSPPEKLIAVTQILEHGLSFWLYARPLQLGPHGVVQYYWMDGSQFRSIKSDASAANSRNCIGHWTASMTVSGVGDDLVQQISYVLAVCFALVGQNKSLQKLHRDAYLAPGRTDPSSEDLPAADCRRIRQILLSRDRSLVEEDLDRVIGRFQPPIKVLPRLQEASRRWVGHGVSLRRPYGDDGPRQ